MENGAFALKSSDRVESGRNGWCNLYPVQNTTASISAVVPSVKSTLASLMQMHSNT